LKFAIELQAVYLRGTTYLWTPLFGIIPVVTLFVKGAEAVGTAGKNFTSVGCSAGEKSLTGLKKQK